jgi:hypothetical protein
VVVASICSEIRSARAQVGHTRCDIVEGRMSIVEAARSFDLEGDNTTYRCVETPEAESIAIRLLRAGLAHEVEIMSLPRAKELWRRFLDVFEGQNIRLVTNASQDATSWTPATQSTFDMGVLVIGTDKVGCLWVEEED